MVSGISGNPQIAVRGALEQIANDATTDLQGVVDKIDKNSENKAKLRTVRKKAEAFKNCIRNGDMAGAAKARLSLMKAMDRAGLDGQSEIGKLLGKMPVGLPGGGQGLKRNPDGSVTTKGGYTLTFDKSYNTWNVYGPGQKPGKDKPLTKIHNDPIVDESDGTRWEFTKDSNFVLPDGTTVFCDTTSDTGFSVSKNLTIVSGNDRIDVTGIDKNKPNTGSVKQDGQSWLEKHLGGQSKYDTFSMTESGASNVNWHKNGEGLITGSSYDSGSKTYKQKTDTAKGLKEKWDDFFQSFDRILDGEIQSVSDISQKLQFQLTQANNIFNRMTKMKFDVAAKYARTEDAIAASIKG